MIGEEIISGVINGFFARHKLEKWARLIFSIFMSSFVTGSGVCGAGICLHLNAGMRPALALAFGFGESCVAVAAVCAFLWQHSELTKGMELTIPSSIMHSETDMLVQNGITQIKPK